MKLKLESDFKDWYDHQFDLSGTTFVRNSNGGMSRSDMFRFFESKGIKSPVNGKVTQVVNTLKLQYNDVDFHSDVALGSFISVVVYTDETKHCGEGKELMSLKDAIQKYPDHYCSEFIPTVAGSGSYSLRYLQVGDRIFWLRYSSDNWKSNCGVGLRDVEVLTEEKSGFHPRIDYPLWAIDFVVGQKIYAIDFNIAPGLEPLQYKMSAVEVVDAIKRYYERK